MVRTTSSGRIIGVLLLYYEEKQTYAEKTFRKIIHSISPNAITVVVSNNSKISGREILEGDNRVWEFTGWQKAIETVGTINDADTLVLANDTFCFHRDWSVIDRMRYTQRIKLLNRRVANGICGEIGSFGQSFKIDDLQSDKWVSTHFFALRGRTFREIGGELPLTEAFLEEVVSIQEDTSIYWSASLSRNLQDYLSQWLGKGPGPTWRSSKSASTKLIHGKARAIINEIHLSAACASQGAKFIDLRPSSGLQFIRKVRKKIGSLLIELRALILIDRNGSTDEH